METLFGKAVIPFSELLWRFGIASAFGFLLGLDREFRGISVGVRTHMLVALSSAMTMLPHWNCSRNSRRMAAPIQTPPARSRGSRKLLVSCAQA